MELPIPFRPSNPIHIVHVFFEEFLDIRVSAPHDAMRIKSSDANLVVQLIPMVILAVQLIEHPIQVKRLVYVSRGYVAIPAYGVGATPDATINARRPQSLTQVFTGVARRPVVATRSLDVGRWPIIRLAHLNDPRPRARPVPRKPQASLVQELVTDHVKVYFAAPGLDLGGPYVILEPETISAVGQKTIQHLPFEDTVIGLHGPGNRQRYECLAEPDEPPIVETDTRGSRAEPEVPDRFPITPDHPRSIALLTLGGVHHVRNGLET